MLRLLQSRVFCMGVASAVPVTRSPLFAPRLSKPIPLHLTCLLSSPFSTVYIEAGDEVTEIPRSKIETNFSRSSGAGGQNVNKVNSKAELRFAIAEADWMDDHTKLRLRLMNANAINNAGELVVTSQRHRTQEANLEDAFVKLTALVRKAAKVPIVRKMRTGLTEHAKEERREDKKHRSGVKANRKAPSWDD